MAKANVGVSKMPSIRVSSSLFMGHPSKTNHIIVIAVGGTYRKYAGGDVILAQSVQSVKLLYSG